MQSKFNAKAQRSQDAKLKQPNCGRACAHQTVAGKITRKAFKTFAPSRLRVFALKVFCMDTAKPVANRRSVQCEKGQPSGFSTSSFKRAASGDGSRPHQLASINPTSRRSRKCVRSLSRKAVNFIRTNASSVTRRNVSVSSDSETSGVSAGFSGRTFSLAKTRACPQNADF